MTTFLAIVFGLASAMLAVSGVRGDTSSTARTVVSFASWSLTVLALAFAALVAVRGWP